MLKKLFYKLTNKRKYLEYKSQISKNRRLNILKNGLEGEISKIQNIISNKKEISFLHSGHLGDIINSLPLIQKISENHRCSLYVRANKALPIKYRFYKNSKDLVFLDDKNVDMLIPLLKCQPFLHKVEKFENQKIDINLDLFRNLPINFNEDNIRWYSLLTGVHPDLSKPSLFVKENESFKNKVIIIRSTRRKNIFINYKFLTDYKDLIFVGLKEEYLDLKKDVSNLEFHDCRDFLEMAEIIKSGKFFLGNPSLGYVIAEGLKVPRLLENFPEYHVMNPVGSNAYDFYFQDHFEKLFSDLYLLKS
jgi:hypothetical protein